MRSIVTGSTRTVRDDRVATALRTDTANKMSATRKGRAHFFLRLVNRLRATNNGKHDQQREQHERFDKREA